MKSGDELNGEAIMRVLVHNKEYEMRVSVKKGKKEGIGLMIRKNGTLFMRMMFVNDECEGETVKKNEYGNIVLRGRVSKGKKEGMWIKYDDYGNEIWRGLYRNGKRYSILKEQEGMKGFYSEVSMKGELLSVSEYDDYELLRDGRYFEYEDGKMKRECEYKNGVMMRVSREWTEELMIEYDVNGMRVYEGGFEGDMTKGFIREGEGTEYGIDGKSALYVGGWKNGLREGYGSEFKGLNPVYIGEWKNGMRDGIGKELNENEEVVRRGRWISSVYVGTVKQYEDGYGNDLRVFDTDCLRKIERVEIGNDCFSEVNLFVIDGLNELKSLIIGKNSFGLNFHYRGDQCLIMNCDQLIEIDIGKCSFLWYKSVELKNLPSLITLKMGSAAFYLCNSIVFESMNDWMNDEWDLTRLQSITIGLSALGGSPFYTHPSELIMKSMNDNDDNWSDLPSLTLLEGDGHNFCCIDKVILESNDLWLNLNETFHHSLYMEYKWITVNSIWWGSCMLAVWLINW